MPRELQSTVVDEVVQLRAAHGFDGLAQVLEVVLNEAMKLERTQALGAAAAPTGSSPSRC
ncbi:MAG: hypothetical protein KF688_16795 [Pirellulales bacterium]|nr:hypothetical protein [Pirellulales bacterium]